MAKFKVLNTHTTKIYTEKKKVRNKNGDWQYFEREIIEEISPGAYGHEDIKVGDILEINGRLAKKAAKNPDFEEVKANKQASKKLKAA